MKKYIDYKISVIIPCYNVEKYIRKCLDSLVNQSIGVEHLELILIDDASTDKTVDILKEYEKRYSDNMMVILCEHNGKQGTARNIGLDYATGDYISFVDSDDWFHKDMYNILINLIQKTSSDIVQFRYTGVYDENDIYYEDKCEELKEYMDFNNIQYKVYDYSLNRKEYLVDERILDESCTTKLYRKSIIDKANARYAEGVAYEEPMFTYPLKFYVDRVCVTEAKLYYYRQNPEGTMLKYMNNPVTMTDHLKVQLRLYIDMIKAPFFKDYKDEINLYFIHTFYAEMFFFMAARGILMPVGIFRYIADTLKKCVPDYAQNPYLYYPSLTNDRKVLELIKYENFDDSILEEKIKEYMLKLATKGV